jgi:uncharacterized DUF497 family protein
MDFEWDEAKRDANLAKHGIDFINASGMWQGGVIDPAGRRTVGSEERVVALGAIGDARIVIAVVYTLRNGSRRIISARRARRAERELFVNEFGYGR